MDRLPPSSQMSDSVRASRRNSLVPRSRDCYWRGVSPKASEPDPGQGTAGASGEGGIPGKGPKSIPKILYQCVHRDSNSDVANTLFDLLDATEASARFAKGF